MSLIDWFLIPAAAVTPFNVILAGTGLWWLAMILDCCFTTGIVWLLYVIDEWFESEPVSKDDLVLPDGDEEEGIVEISPKIDKKTKKMLLND